MMTQRIDRLTIAVEAETAEEEHALEAALSRAGARRLPSNVLRTKLALADWERVRALLAAEGLLLVAEFDPLPVQRPAPWSPALRRRNSPRQRRS